MTLSHKQRAAARMALDAPDPVALGAVNTIVVGAKGPLGLNTGQSGFVLGHRAGFEAAAPGRAMVIGAGRVGLSVDFALARLAAVEIFTRFGSARPRTRPARMRADGARRPS